MKTAVTRAFQFTLMKRDLLSPSMPDRSNAYRIIAEAASYDEAIELAKNEAKSIINKTGDQFKPGFLFIEIPLKS